MGSPPWILEGVNFFLRFSPNSVCHLGRALGARQRKNFENRPVNKKKVFLGPKTHGVPPMDFLEEVNFFPPILTKLGTRGLPTAESGNPPKKRAKTRENAPRSAKNGEKRRKTRKKFDTGP